MRSWGKSLTSFFIIFHIMAWPVFSQSWEKWRWGALLPSWQSICAAVHSVTVDLGCWSSSNRLPLILGLPLHSVGTFNVLDILLNKETQKVVCLKYHILVLQSITAPKSSVTEINMRKYEKSVTNGSLLFTEVLVGLW